MRTEITQDEIRLYWYVRASVYVPGALARLAALRGNLYRKL